MKREIVSEDFKKVLLVMADSAKSFGNDTKGFEIKTGVCANCHIEHLSRKLHEALLYIDELESDK